MRDSEINLNPKVCEGCERKLRGATVIGIEATEFTITPTHLCGSCGPIDLELMQFCRELTIGCNDS